jgi:hypothetical protein
MALSGGVAGVWRGVFRCAAAALFVKIVELRLL